MNGHSSDLFWFFKEWISCSTKDFLQSRGNCTLFVEYENTRALIPSDCSFRYSTCRHESIALDPKFDSRWSDSIRETRRKYLCQYSKHSNERLDYLFLSLAAQPIEIEWQVSSRCSSWPSPFFLSIDNRHPPATAQNKRTQTIFRGYDRWVSVKRISK